jgi:hypothetical protein
MSGAYFKEIYIYQQKLILNLSWYEMKINFETFAKNKNEKQPKYSKI